jgi:transposase
MRFDLSDEEWGPLESLIPKARKTARADDRRVMDGIFYVLRTAMPWRDLPERYGPYTTISIASIGGRVAASGRRSLIRWLRDQR